jgi:hypothetical protein
MKHLPPSNGSKPQPHGKQPQWPHLPYGLGAGEEARRTMRAWYSDVAKWRRRAYRRFSCTSLGFTLETLLWTAFVILATVLAVVLNLFALWVRGLWL